MASQNPRSRDLRTTRARDSMSACGSRTFARVRRIGGIGTVPPDHLRLLSHPHERAGGLVAARSSTVDRIPRLCPSRVTGASVMRSLPVHRSATAGRRESGRLAYEPSVAAPPCGGDALCCCLLRRCRRASSPDLSHVGATRLSANPRPVAPILGRTIRRSRATRYPQYWGGSGTLPAVLPRPRRRRTASPPTSDISPPAYSSPCVSCVAFAALTDGTFQAAMAPGSPVRQLRPCRAGRLHTTNSPKPEMATGSSRKRAAAMAENTAPIRSSAVAQVSTPGTSRARIDRDGHRSGAAGAHPTPNLD